MTDARYRTLVGIIDDYNSIKLKTLSRDGKPEILCLAIDDARPGQDAAFFFDNAHEARTFFTRALHQVGLYTIESTPAEDLKAEIFRFFKQAEEGEYMDTGTAIGLLRDAAKLF